MDAIVSGDFEISASAWWVRDAKKWQPRVLIARMKGGAAGVPPKSKLFTDLPATFASEQDATIFAKYWARKAIDEQTTGL